MPKHRDFLKSAIFEHINGLFCLVPLCAFCITTITTLIIATTDTIATTSMNADNSQILNNF